MFQNKKLTFNGRELVTTNWELICQEDPLLKVTVA